VGEAINQFAANARKRPQTPANAKGTGAMHQLPLFEPESNWVAPISLPDLRGKVKQIAIDTEGNDEGLSHRMGSGWPTRWGWICGLSAAWREGEQVKSFYAPTQHPATTCLDACLVADWVAKHAQAGITMITHHGSHDWGWMRTEWGLKCAPQIADTEAMAMLVDENQLSYSLDRLCGWRQIKGKDERQLKVAAELYGLDLKSELWRLPAKHVGPYAEQDATATLLLAENLMGEIEEQQLQAALQLEHDLMPMVLEMRLRGIAVDEEAAHKRKYWILRERDRVLARLARKLGRESVTIEECRSPKSLEKMFVDEGVDNPNRTEKTGRMAFQAPWMRKHPHWLPRFVARAEQLTDVADKFIQNFIIDYARNGRLHASINQFRGEEGGTRSYRFSYADPPLQQAPHRDERFAKVFRGAFKPEAGELWASADYSQQEYRLIVHYAASLGLPKAAETAQSYVDDPNTDFHALVARWTGLDRKRAKDCNFAKAYGAGIQRFAEMIGRPAEQAHAIMQQYDRELPFVNMLSHHCMDRARERGFIRLLDGARSHFNMYERVAYQQGVGFEPAQPSRAAAEAKWPGQQVRRAHTHKALNRLIQGSAARQTKLWMQACWREGLVPLLQMHDELCFSIASESQIGKICELGRDVVQLRVPMKVDAATGPNWAEAE